MHPLKELYIENSQPRNVFGVIQDYFVDLKILQVKSDLANSKFIEYIK